VCWEEDGRGKEEAGRGDRGGGEKGERVRGGQGGEREGREGRREAGEKRREEGEDSRGRGGREKECVRETERVKREILMMILIKAYRNTALFPCCSGVQ